MAVLFDAVFESLVWSSIFLKKPFIHLVILGCNVKKLLFNSVWEILLDLIFSVEIRSSN